MKYFLILLLSTASLISVDGKIPDYIQICKRNDPKINDCIRDSILNMKDKLVTGIPELGVPPLDPQRLEKIVFNLGSGFKAEGRDLIVVGGKNFQIHDVVADIDANTYTFAVSIPEITANGTYDIDATIVGIPLKGKGPVKLTAKSLSARGTLRGKKIMRGGKPFVWFSSMTIKVVVGDYDIRLENLFEGDPTIGEVTNKLLNEEKSEILASFLPELEKTLIEYHLSAANNIVKYFTWDELFPES